MRRNNVREAIDLSKEVARLRADNMRLRAAAKEALEHSPFHASDCAGVVEYEEAVIFDDRKGCDCYLSRLRAAIGEVT